MAQKRHLPSWRVSRVLEDVAGVLRIRLAVAVVPNNPNGVPAFPDPAR